MKNTLRALIGMWVATLVGSLACANVTIDSFEDRPTGFPITAEQNSGMLVLPANYPHVVGSRDFNLSVVAASDTDSATVDITSAGGENLLAYTSTDGAYGSFLLDYGNSPTGMQLAINPSIGAIRLHFSSYSHSSAQDLLISGTFISRSLPDSYSITQSATLAEGLSADIDLPLAGFDGNTLDALSLKFQVPAGAAFDLDSVDLVTNVPEPQLALFGLAFGWILHRGRRRSVENVSSDKMTADFFPSHEEED